MLPKSIEYRVVKLMESGVEVSEAIKQAFKEEEAFYREMIEQKTKRSKKAKDKICKDVYHSINLLF